MDLSQNENPNSRMQVSLPLIVIGGIIVVAFGFIIGAFAPSVLPVVASAEGQQVDQLFQVLLIIGGAVFALVHVVLLYSIVRFRAKPGETLDGPSVHGNVALEVVWTAIPAVIVFGLTIYSWTIWQVTTQPRPDELVVEALGQRYAWQFTYTDPLNRLANFPPEQQSFSASVLHTYVGQAMLIRINAADVNHAFWVPTMRIKQDALVGRTTEVRFTPTRAGRYRVVCAELCGGAHGAMYTYIEVHPDLETYRYQFLDPQVNNIINPPDDPVLIGRNLLANAVYACAGCHVLTDLGWSGVTGPSLNGIGNRAAARASASGLRSAEEYLAHSIRYPADYQVPGYPVGAGGMPQFGPTQETPAVVEGANYVYMPDTHLEGIVAYLCAQTESGDPTTTACGDIESIRAAVAEQSQ